jgi:hypothetical protein
LAHAAEELGDPVIAVPTDIPQPRAALGALAAPPLVVLERLGLLPEVGDLLAEAVQTLEHSRDQLVRPGSVAQQLARQIGRTIPLVHGAPGPTGVAALRWKTQVNENAKAPAFWSAQPELCHNEVAGWGQHGDVTRQLLTLVQLRYGGEEPRVGRRFRLVRELVSEATANVLEVRTDASSERAPFGAALLPSGASAAEETAETTSGTPLTSANVCSGTASAWSVGPVMARTWSCWTRLQAPVTARDGFDVSLYTTSWMVLPSTPPEEFVWLTASSVPISAA